MSTIAGMIKLDDQQPKFLFPLRSILHSSKSFHVTAEFYQRSFLQQPPGNWIRTCIACMQHYDTLLNAFKRCT